MAAVFGQLASKGAFQHGPVGRAATLTTLFLREPGVAADRVPVRPVERVEVPIVNGFAVRPDFFGAR